nr:MAG TPA: hypothetical protein [Caudoviricetes sp.]
MKYTYLISTHLVSAHFIAYYSHFQAYKVLLGVSKVCLWENMLFEKHTTLKQLLKNTPSHKKHTIRGVSKFHEQ